MTLNHMLVANTVAFALLFGIWNHSTTLNFLIKAGCLLLALWNACILFGVKP